MHEIGSYVACIVLLVAGIWYWRFLRGNGDATTCPCGLLSFLNLVPLAWPTRAPSCRSHLKRLLVPIVIDKSKPLLANLHGTTNFIFIFVFYFYQMKYFTPQRNKVQHITRPGKTPPPPDEKTTTHKSTHRPTKGRPNSASKNNYRTIPHLCLVLIQVICK
jgi:hypothetical protein